MKDISKLRFSFITYLTTLSLLLLLTILGFASIFSYTFHKKTTVELTQQWTNEISKTIYLKTNDFLKPAEHQAEYMATILQQYKLLSVEDTFLQSLLLQNINQYPQFRSCYIGLANGDFAMFSDDFNKKLTLIYHNKLNKTIKRLDSDNKIVSTDFLPKNNYDPRLRQWYQGALNAQGLYWTSPYIFHSNQQLGISVSFPIMQQAALLGVVSIDILLKELNLFLSDILITPSSLMYILDDSNAVVAASDPRKDSYLDEAEFNSIIQFSQDMVLNAGNKQNSIQQTFVYNKKEYILLVQQYPKDFLSNWKTVMIVPQSELFYSLIKSNQQLLILGLIISILGIIFVIIFSRSISSQIHKISEHAMKLKQLNFESKLDMKTQISELDNLHASINTMETGIKSFFHYVPKEIVRQLIKSNQEASISGQSKTITLLFTDIAKFTNITETIDPAQLAVLLSDYFEKTDVMVKKNKGIIDKFIGDSTMAIWGAPADNQNHAIDACHCGLDLNKTLNPNKSTLFKTRIGIHTGNVIVGNIGAKNRFNYTAVGKEVNIANRLEGINKFYSTTILISQSTYNLVKDIFICRPLDKVKVVGISYPLQIYELIGVKRSSNKMKQTYIAQFSHVHSQFQLQQWKVAIEGFEKLKDQSPKDHILDYYINLAKQFFDSPPDQDWNGVIEMKTK